MKRMKKRSLALFLAVGCSLLLAHSVSASTPAFSERPSPSQEIISDTHHIFIPLLQSSSTSQPWLPNDPYYASQWAFDKADVLPAWQYSRGGGILLAIVDSGVDYQHADLTNKIRYDLDWDFVNDDDEAQDDLGHGTHVSGIAAATTNNAEGVVGMGWETEILPLKILDESGNGSIANVIAAIYYATDAGADIVNMSFTTSPSYELQCSQIPALLDAVTYAYQHGVLLVSAAGNGGVDASKIVPANCPYVLTVAATNSDDSIASYSNYGDVVDIAAPGSSIYSTFLDNTYRVKSGTSMATPFVAGLAALVWSRYPDLTPDEVASALLETALDLGENGWDSVFGCGRVSAAPAVMMGRQVTSACQDSALQPEPASLAHAPDFGGAFVADGLPGQLIVHLSDVSAAASGMPDTWVTSSHVLGEGWVALSVPAGSEEALAQKWLAEGVVTHVQPDYEVSVE